MKPQNRTLLHAAATIIVFGTCLALFTGISIGLMIVGILWAFQLFFSVGWWAGLATFAVMLALYATILSFGLELMERKEA